MCGDLNKDMFLEVHNKTVVKYDVYFDILLVGSIYVTTYSFFKDNSKPPSSCKPRHPGLGTGMLHVYIPYIRVRVCPPNGIFGPCAQMRSTGKGANLELGANLEPAI